MKVHYNLAGAVQSLLAKERFCFFGAREIPSLTRQGSRGVLANCVESDSRLFPAWLCLVPPSASLVRRLGPSPGQHKVGRGALVLPG